MPWTDLDWTERDRLRKARIAAGFRDTSALSAATGWPDGGVTRQSIERWESGRHEPQGGKFAQVLAVLADRLEVEAPALARYIATGERPDR